VPSDFSIRHAAHIVKNGGIIAYPTDTIYGLGCDPYNPDAIEKINRIKQRPLNKQFILLAGHINQLRSLIQISKQQEKTITQNTEPTSWVVKASECAPSWLIDSSGSLTIRISKHEDVKRLCQALDHAIISTSANISGKTPAKNSFDLHRYFHHKVDKILVSNTKPTAKASKIIRLCDNYVIRD
jgi:L-threonylcarbamoyladenylate synthase